jgi:hypothetical protein
MIAFASGGPVISRQIGCRRASTIIRNVRNAQHWRTKIDHAHDKKTACDFELPQTSVSASGRGSLPSVSLKPYSIAKRAATKTPPVCRMTSGSAARAVTARPINSGDSELLRSSHAAACRTFSVLTSPGYRTLR